MYLFIIILFVLYFFVCPIFTLELSKKSDFQPSTTKPDNIGHRTVKTGQIWPLGGFEGGFAFSKKINKSR